MEDEDSDLCSLKGTQPLSHFWVVFPHVQFHENSKKDYFMPPSQYYISQAVCSALLNCYNSAHIRLEAAFASQELNGRFEEVACSAIETAV